MKVKKTFNYKGSCDKIFLHAGAYYVELWGAQGKDCISNGENYSFGGYSKGLLFLNKGTAVSICVGGKGEQVKGGWNGGGDSVAINSNCAPGGGGMTDLSIGDEKILIAGGGGGSSKWSTFNRIGGNGGGTSGTEDDGIRDGKAGTSTSGGKGGYYGGGSSGNIIYEPCNASSGTKYQGGNGCSTANASPGGGGGAILVAVLEQTWEVAAEAQVLSTMIIF